MFICYYSLIPVIDYKVLIDKVLPFINGLINDSVPNIRFNVAKSYLILVESLINKKKSGQLSETNDQELKNSLIHKFYQIYKNWKMMMMLMLDFIQLKVLKVLMKF